VVASRRHAGGSCQDRSAHGTSSAMVLTPFATLVRGRILPAAAGRRAARARTEGGIGREETRQRRPREQDRLARRRMPLLEGSDELARYDDRFPLPLEDVPWARL